MTEKETEIVQKLGNYSYVIYSYIKTRTNFSNTKVAVGLGIPYDTVRKTLKKLESFNIIKRSLKDNNKRTIVINNEADWEI